ncbi:MAG: hypothetical protein HKN03_07100 [Acidimicrobiales bacterium]|nr:hypothetical protein [Acidimicrobiales bacterium]
MLSSPSGSRRIKALLFFAFLLLPVFAVPVFAHGGIIQGVPGPGQSVGGSVDTVQLLFAEPVNEAIVTIENSAGRFLGGTLNQPVSNLLELSTDGITVDDDYIVRYSVTFDDGVDFSSAYQFTYSEGSPAPLPIDPASVSRSQGINLPALLIAFGVAVVVLLLLRLALRLKKLRSAERAPLSA